MSDTKILSAEDGSTQEQREMLYGWCNLAAADNRMVDAITGLLVDYQLAKDSQEETGIYLAVFAEIGKSVDAPKNEPEPYASVVERTVKLRMRERDAALRKIDDLARLLSCSENTVGALRQRISDLEDAAARLEGRMGVAINRIRVLEAEQDVLLEGLSSCVLQLENYNQEPVEAYKQAVVAAQALLGKEEPETQCECERAGINTDGTCSHCGGRIMSPSDAADIYAKRVSVKTGKRIQSPTERTIKVGDQVRHRRDEWTAVVKEIQPDPVYGGFAIFEEPGGFWRLSQLERVEPAKAKS